MEHPDRPRLLLPGDPGTDARVPPPPRAPRPRRAGDWVGLAAVSAVVTVALLVASGAVWQLWLSNVWGDYQQRRAEAALAAAEENPALVLPVGVTLAAVADGSAPSTTAPVGLPPVPPALAGQPLGRVTAPAAGIDATFVSGTTVEDLRAGPGWMAGTAFPGTPGNAVLSGHRTTYGAPFGDIDRLAPGDRVTVEVPGWGTTVFEVRATLVVAPGDVWVATATDGVRLTLTTCHPAGSDRERLVVQAEAVEGPAARLATAPAAWAPSAPR